MAGTAMRLTILPARGETFFAPIDEPDVEPMLSRSFLETQGCALRQPVALQRFSSRRARSMKPALQLGLFIWRFTSYDYARR